MQFPQEYEWLLEVQEKCLGATWDYKEEWGSFRFLVAGKIFALLGKNNKGDKIITVKGIPEENEQFRTMYRSVGSGYYMNKEHWISIELEVGEVSQDFIGLRLLTSYQLIVQKLPKKTKQALFDQEEV